MYLIQLYVISLSVQVGGFLHVHQFPPNKTMLYVSLNFFPTYFSICPKAKFRKISIYSNKFFHNIFTCPNPVLLVPDNRIGGVMVSMLISSAVDRGFEPRSGQTKDYKIGICSFSAKHAALRRKNKNRLARNQD